MTNKAHFINIRFRLKNMWPQQKMQKPFSALLFLLLFFWWYLHFILWLKTQTKPTTAEVQTAIHSIVLAIYLIKFFPHAFLHILSVFRRRMQQKNCKKLL